MRKTLGVSLFGTLMLIGMAMFPISARAGVSASPSSVNFGTATVNTTTSPATITISNASRQSVILDGLSSSVPAFSISGPAFPLTLPGFGKATFQVRFAPVSAVAYTGEISVILSRNRRTPPGFSLGNWRCCARCTHIRALRQRHDPQFR
jgi:hypothetical protein